MSWDVSILGEWPLPDGPGYQPPPLCTGDEVRGRISAHLPGVDWTDPTWGLYGGDRFTFEFSVGADEPVNHIAVHVRGGGDAVADLLRFAVPNGWHLIDWSTGERIDPSSPSNVGWHGWQAYRDHVRDVYRAGPDAEPNAAADGGA